MRKLSSRSTSNRPTRWTCSKPLGSLVSCISSVACGQHDDRISTIDFVQILNSNAAEATYFYQNNWKVVREKALERGHIHSYQVLETPSSQKHPFDLLLITTYDNEEQYASREEHLAELIKEQRGLKLLNEKKPGEFRKTLFSKDRVRHWKGAER